MENNYKIAKYWFDDKSQANTTIVQLESEDVFTQIITDKFKISEAVINEQGEVTQPAVFDEQGLMVDVIYIGNTQPNYMAYYRVEPTGKCQINISGLDYTTNKHE